MPKIRKLPSGSWQTRVYVGKIDDKNVYKSITRPTKDEVYVALAEFKQQKKHPKELTVAECVRNYIDISAPTISPTTISSYEKVLAHAFPDLMKMKVSDLTTDVVQLAINKEMKRCGEKTGKPISAKTVHNEWGLISSALKNEDVNFNIKLPKIQRKNTMLPEPQEVLKALRGSYVELPCLLAFWCGMRLSEIRGLTYDSIHGDELWIDKVVVDVDNLPTLKHYAKTDTSIRKVNLPPYIKQLIDNSTYPPKYTEDGKFRFVVPLNRNAIYGQYKTIMNRAGIDISFHALRHMFATVSLQVLRLDAKTVQNAGGWKTDYVMRQVYNNTIDSVQQESNNKRNEYFGNMLQDM